MKANDFLPRHCVVLAATTCLHLLFVFHCPENCFQSRPPQPQKHFCLFLQNDGHRAFKLWHLTPCTNTEHTWHSICIILSSVQMVPVNWILCGTSGIKRNISYYICRCFPFTTTPVPASQHKQTKKQTHGYLSYDICSQQYFSITNCFRKSIFIKKLDFCRQFSECFSFQLFILDVNKTNRRIREGWIQFGAGDIFVWLYQIALSTQSGLDVNKVLQTIQEARR